MASVFRNFTQSQLDTQYSPSRWVTRLTPLNAILSHVARLQQGTVACEQSSACVEKKLRYSSHEACTLDLHHPQTVLPSAPLLVYIHGGYWCAGVLENSGAWMADCLIGRTQCSVAAVEYGLCDRVSLDECVNHVRLAVAFLYKRYPTRPMVLVGHSAGGHLVAMLLSTNWHDPTQPYCLPGADVPFKVCVPVSGIYDLEPVRLSCVNAESNLHLENDVEQTRRNSPIQLLSQATQNCAHGKVKVVVVVAAGDSPEFRRQSRDYYNELKSGEFLEVQGKDHFSIIEELDEPCAELTQVIIREISALGEIPQSRSKSSLFPLFALSLVLLALSSRRYE